MADTAGEHADADLLGTGFGNVAFDGLQRAAGFRTTIARIFAMLDLRRRGFEDAADFGRTFGATAPRHELSVDQSACGLGKSFHVDRI